MTPDADYSIEEWDLILGAPGLVALVIVHAQRCGPRSTHQKLLAVLAAIAETRVAGAQSGLTQAVVDAVQRGRSPLWPTECPFDLEAVHEWALDSCHQVAILLAKRAPEAEGRAYADWLLGIAQQVAAVPADDAPAGGSAEPHAELRHVVLEVLAAALDAPPLEPDPHAGITLPPRRARALVAEPRSL